MMQDAHKLFISNTLASQACLNNAALIKQLHKRESRQPAPNNNGVVATGRHALAMINQKSKVERLCLRPRQRQRDNSRKQCTPHKRRASMLIGVAEGSTWRGRRGGCAAQTVLDLGGCTLASLDGPAQVAGPLRRRLRASKVHLA